MYKWILKNKGILNKREYLGPVCPAGVWPAYDIPFCSIITYFQYSLIHDLARDVLSNDTTLIFFWSDHVLYCGTPPTLYIHCKPYENHHGGHQKKQVQVDASKKQQQQQLSMEYVIQVGTRLPIPTSSFIISWLYARSSSTFVNLSSIWSVFSRTSSLP